MRQMGVSRAGACVFGVLMLSGCSVPTRVPVKNVLADQAGFLAANFSPAQIAPGVRAAVAAADPGPLGFRKMVLKLAWTANSGNGADPVHVDETLTLADAGNSFVQSLSQVSRNDIPVSQQDRIGYRGLFFLRSQDFSMTASESAYAFIVGDLKHFDVIGPKTDALRYEYGIGFPGDTSGFAQHLMTCQVGKAYPAKRVFADFQGSARNLDCAEYNSYGALSDRSRFAYLQRYGVAIKVRYADARTVEEAKVVGASIR